MNKNVLILSGSPRKNGNSETLCRQFELGAKDAGNHVELLSLRDQEIRYCTGCGACNTTHRCVQKDQMAEILDKMCGADVIVMATPVYFYTMDAQMKTLIDRTVPRYQEITGKDFYFILTAADTQQENLERTMVGFRGFTEECLEGAVEKGVLYATGVWNKGEVDTTSFMEQAYQMGHSV